jgi:hypothetical protein
MNARTLEQVGGTLAAIVVVWVLAWIAMPMIVEAIEAWVEVWRVVR